MNGYDVKILDVRGIEYLEGKEFVGILVCVEDVIKNIDVFIIFFFIKVMLSIWNIID